MSSGVFEEKGEGFEGVVGAGSPELVVSLGRVGELGHDSSSGVEYVDEDGLRVVVVGVVVALFGFVFFEEECVGCFFAAFDVAIIWCNFWFLVVSKIDRKKSKINLEFQKFNSTFHALNEFCFKKLCFDRF